MNNKLTQRDAFKAMVLFLEHYFKKYNYDDLRDLLSGMAFLIDEGTADPAVWEDWIDAINKIKSSQTDANLSDREAYEAVRRYLDDYQDRGPSFDVAAVLAHMYLSSARIAINPITWNIWLQCIADAKAGKGDFYLRFGKPCTDCNEFIDHRDLICFNCTPITENH